MNVTLHLYNLLLIPGIIFALIGFAGSEAAARRLVRKDYDIELAAVLLLVFIATLAAVLFINLAIEGRVEL